MHDDRNNKDIEKTNKHFVSNVQSNPFGSNISADKAYRKGERIVAALYLLTKHISDAEPIKRLAREAGHMLLKDIMALRSGFRIDPGSSLVSSVHMRAREVISMTQLLAVGGFASRENADLLTRAAEELSQFIESSRNTELSEGVVFSKEDLLLDQTGRGNTARVKRDVVSIGSAAKIAQTDGKSENGQNSVRDSNSGRRGAILEVLKDGRQMGIKDIASFVVGCSEKTVQRELASLISDGLVKKEGKKRWSRYSLII